MNTSHGFPSSALRSIGSVILRPDRRCNPIQRRSARPPGCCSPKSPQPASPLTPRPFFARIARPSAYLRGPLGVYSLSQSQPNIPESSNILDRRSRQHDAQRIATGREDWALEQEPAASEPTRCKRPSTRRRRVIYVRRACHVELAMNTARLFGNGSNGERELLRSRACDERKFASFWIGCTSVRSEIKGPTQVAPQTRLASACALSFRGLGNRNLSTLHRGFRNQGINAM